MLDEQRPLKVFLCHAHSDVAAVRALYLRLRREGVDVWLDKEKLLPGSDWEFEIRKAVHNADVVVVCLSKQFNQAGFRQKEVRIALETAMEKPEGEIFIIPARLEECENLESLSKWHWVDLFETDGYQKLIRALRTRADRIGATLRIHRGGQSTTSHPKNNEPAEKTAREQEAHEKAEIAARGKSEREAGKKARREEAGSEATKEVLQEKAKRETTEKVEHENAEKSRQEAAEHEATAQEKAEHEKTKTDALEGADYEVKQKDTQEKRFETQNVKTQRNRKVATIIALIGLVGVALITSPVLSNLISGISVSTSTVSANLVFTYAVQTVQAMYDMTETPEPTSTISTNLIITDTAQTVQAMYDMTETPEPTVLPTKTTEVKGMPTLLPAGGTLVTEDFDMSSLNSSLWAFSSNSNGSTYSIQNGILTIESGTTDGGGGEVSSINEFLASEGFLILEIKAKIDSRIPSYWGFRKNAVGSVLIGPGSEGVQAELGDVASGALIYPRISNVNPEGWHVYRIELSPDGVAHFFIDGVYSYTQADGIPSDIPLEIYLGSSSRGSNTRLMIDYVILALSE